MKKLTHEQKKDIREIERLQHEVENLTGNLTFYQFDFTLDNVMDIIGDSKPASKACIILPLEGNELSGVEAPERIRITTDRDARA